MNATQKFMTENNIVTSKGKVNPQLTRWDKFAHLIEWIDDNKPFEAPLVESIFALYNGLEKKPLCKSCLKCDVKFLSYTKGYAQFCSHDCYGTDLRGRPYSLSHLSADERAEMYKRGVEKRRRNSGYVISDTTKEKMSKSAKRTMASKRKTWLLKYGVSNPGVLGGNTSKSAINYIKDFISDMGFSEDQCMFDDGKTNQEFFQMIDVPYMRKKKFSKFDLVVFDSVESKSKRDVSRVIAVLEYNGPWHYSLRDVINDPHSPSTPYKNCTASKKQSYQYDAYKRKHFSHVKDYFVYWERSDSLVRGNLTIGV